MFASAIASLYLSGASEVLSVSMVFLCSLAFAASFGLLSVYFSPKDLSKTNMEASCPSKPTPAKPGRYMRQDSDAQIPVDAGLEAAKSCEDPISASSKVVPACLAARPAHVPTKIPKPLAPTSPAASPAPATPAPAASPSKIPRPPTFSSLATKPAAAAAQTPSPAPSAPTTPTAAAAQQPRPLLRRTSGPAPLSAASKAACSKAPMRAAPLGASMPTLPRAAKPPTPPRKPASRTLYAPTASSRLRQEERAREHASSAAAAPKPAAAAPAAAKGPLRRLPSSQVKLQTAQSSEAQWLSGGLLLWSNPLCSERCWLSADLELRFSSGEECSWLSAPLDEAFLVAA